MFSVGQRSAAVFFHGVSVMLFLVALSWVSTLFTSPVVDGSVALDSVQWIGHNPRLGYDEASITMNIATDLRPLFDWTVKQIFLTVTVEYVAQNRHSKLVVWDEIITDRRKAKILVEARANKYYITDLGRGLTNNKFKFYLNYYVIPMSGKEWSASIPCSEFVLPTYSM